jgi:tetratricopeptide (TPR) repeat protein
MGDPAGRPSVSERREPVRAHIPLILRSAALLFTALILFTAAPSVFAATPVDDILARQSPLSRPDLERLYQYRLDRGAANLSVVSCFLIRASKRLLQEGNAAAAHAYAEYALNIAPDYPPAYTHMALVRWTENRLRVDALFEGLCGYLHATITNYVAAAVPLTKMLLLLLFSVLFTISTFALVSFYKYFKLLVHDLSHMLPAPLPRHFALCCALFALCLPLFLGCSVIITALSWLAVLFLYHSRREQQLVVLFALFFLLSPLLIQVIAQLVTTHTSETFYHAYQVTNENWGEETEPMLARRTGANPYDADALFALALLHKREGRIREAQQLYTRLLERDPSDCRVWCNLGNTFLAEKKYDQAIAHYTRSIELCPESVEGHYNLSRVQLLEYLFAESNKNFNRAKALDSDRVDRFLHSYSGNSNRLVVDQISPASVYWQRTFAASDAQERLSAQLWNYFFRGISYRYRYAVIAIFLLFVALLCIDRQTYRLSLACEYCGCAVCRKCKRLVLEHRLCKQCAAIFKSANDIMISVSKKEEQVASIERYQGRKLFAGKLLSVLLPGTGHLLVDHPLRGTAILFVFFLLLSKLLFWDTLLVNPWQMINGPAYLRMLLVAIPLIILYLYALGHFNFSSMKLFQFLSLIRVTRRELQIKE